MGVAIKVISALLVIGGLWIWFSGRSVKETPEPVVVPEGSLSASVALAPRPAGAFDEEGTIIIDRTNGDPGVPYILYTDYSAKGKPSVKTKRLVFPDQAECVQKNLSCATDQPPPPVRADEKVRITGSIDDETVIVATVEHISS